MTIAEACVLLVDTTLKLSAASREREGYRLVLHEAVHLLHAYGRKIDGLRRQNEGLRAELRGMQERAAA